ncbi:MAG: hypothetical protein U0903_04050 [Planctomycetales bacterium]
MAECKDTADLDDRIIARHTWSRGAIAHSCHPVPKTPFRNLYVHVNGVRGREDLFVQESLWSLETPEALFWMIGQTEFSFFENKNLNPSLENEVILLAHFNGATGFRGILDRILPGK